MSKRNLSIKAIKQKIANTNKELKDSSIDQYLLVIKKLYGYLFTGAAAGAGGSVTKFNIKFLNDYESVIEFLENTSGFALPTKRNYITAILVISKGCSDVITTSARKEYVDYHKQLTNLQNDIYSNNVKTEKEEQNWISRDDITKVIDSLYLKVQSLIDRKDSSTQEIINLFQMYLILNLYTLLPPLRNDFAGETILLPKEIEKYRKKNRIILDSAQLILVDYKTSSSYGTKIIDLPEELVDILSTWVSIRRELLKDSFACSYLLIKLRDPSKFMSKNMLTKTLNKIFYPKKVSTTILRKVYLSEKYPVVNTYKQMQEDAYIMGHDINTAKLVYSKKLD